MNTIDSSSTTTPNHDGLTLTALALVSGLAAAISVALAIIAAW